MIKVTNLTKKYGEFKALDDVNFEVETGKITGFLGPNGAGKTTCMRIITGFLELDQGKVIFENNLDIKQNREQLLMQIGYLPENNPLYKNLRVDEFIRFNAQIKGLTNMEDLAELLKKCGLDKVANKQISTLSKGYKQRVGLAKALLGDVKYLILDEPTTGLDPIQKEEILSLIKSLAKDKTIIFSSHALDEVKKIADKIIIINQGKVAAQGETSLLAKQHLKKSVISVVTDAKSEQFKSQLKLLDFVDQIDKVTTIKQFNHYKVIVNNASDATSQIYKLAVKNKWLLSELYLQEQSLDNLFKELTK